MSNTRKNIRKAVWSGDSASAKDVGEAIQDLYQITSSFTSFAVIDISTAYAPPFKIAYDHIPVAVLVGRVLLQKQPITVAGGVVSWVWDGKQITVNSISGLTVGALYEIIFLVFG